MQIEKVRHNGRSYTNASYEDLIAHGVPHQVVMQSAATQLGRDVDAAAGVARSAFVSPGPYIDQEYQQAKQEAQAWLDGGKDANAIPSSVSDHMAMFGVGAEAAATEIVATAEQWEQALSTIRSARLGGKAAVRSAETVEAAEQAAKAAIAELNAIRPPEGSL